jgi:signal transduction histidine kinase
VIVVPLRRLAAAGLVAVLATVVLTGVTAGPVTTGFWLRILFMAGWLFAAVVVARRGEPGVAGAVTVVFLIAFPVAFSGVSAGVEIVDQVWRAVGSISLVAFLYLFPRGQFEPRWTAASCAVSSAYLIARAFLPGLAAWPGDLVVFPLIVLVPLGLQVTRFRSASNPGDRRRLQLVGLTSAAALGGQLILFALLSAGWLGPTAAAESIVEPVAYALALLLPAGLVFALVPVGSAARTLADHLTFVGDDEASLIAQLNSLTQESSSGRDLLPIAAEAIRRSLRLPEVTIDQVGSDASADAATPTAEPAWPLIYRGELVGHLRVTPRRGQPLSKGDRQILDRLAVELAPMIGAVHLTRQLDTARTRLVAAREEERRRLRADLHDELGATLAGLTLKTGLAGELVERDPAATRRLLTEIEATLATSVDRVRELVENLRPAQLDELGLDAAIKEQAQRLMSSSGPMELRVYGHADPGLPAAVELAAFRIAQEALTNAVRHSGAAHVDVELTVAPTQRQLTVRVADDGVGMRQAEPPGFGLQSMRQRAREVGGDCVIGSGDEGGVAVIATLPLPVGGNS